MRRFNAKRIAIIGAGPSGLAAAKYFQAEKAFSQIVVFEQRNNVGGLWTYTPETSGDGMLSVPQTEVNIGLETPVFRKKSRGSKGEAIFLSPIYEKLETNIPKSLMGYSDTKFLDSLQLFPGHEEVERYLEDYAKPVLSLIKFQLQVENVRFKQEIRINDTTMGEEWSVESRNLTTGEKLSETYDAVVVASGHYSTPYIPIIPGVQEWNHNFLGSISHSKYFRTPQAFVEQTVIVVGNSASGLDISSQISSVCRKVLLSQKSESYLAGGFAENPKIESVSKISRLDPENKIVIFSDGRVERNVDSILFCTGYLYTLPFLHDISPNPVGNGTRIEHTYQHLFYTPHPTLSFLALPQKVIPFPLSEAQSAVLARVYSSRLTLPSEKQMESWEEATIAEHGSEGDFHTLKFPKDAEYINLLCDWAAKAESREGMKNGGKGELAHKWGPWEYWARENFPKIRKAFVQRGEDRKYVTSLAELGFSFEHEDSNEDHAGADADDERLG